MRLIAGPVKLRGLGCDCGDFTGPEPSFILGGNYSYGEYCLAWGEFVSQIDGDLILCRDLTSSPHAHFRASSLHDLLDPLFGIVRGGIIEIERGL